MVVLLLTLAEILFTANVERLGHLPSLLFLLFLSFSFVTDDAQSQWGKTTTTTQKHEIKTEFKPLPVRFF